MLRSTWKRPLTLAFGAACAWVAVPAGALGAAPPYTEEALLRPVIAALATYRDGGEPVRRRALEDIVELGPRAVPAVYLLRTGLFVPPSDDGPLLEREGQELLLDALRAWPARTVGERLLGELDGEAPLGAQLTLIGLVGEAADVRSFGLLLERLSAAPPDRLRLPELDRRIERALGAALARERGSFHELRNHLAQVHVALLPPVARALAAHGGAGALTLLVELLGRDVALDLTVLRALGDLDLRAAVFADGTRVDAVRPHLDSDIAAVRLQAAVTLGRLHDEDSFGPILELLSDPDARVRAGALRALRQLSGMGWPADSERWEAWYDAQVSWLEQRSVQLAGTARSADPTLALRAMRELSAHRVFRGELAPSLVDLLRHRNANVAAGACLGLARLGDPTTIPDLIGALADERPAVRSTAHRALVELSGESLLADPTTWYLWLDRQAY